MRRIIFSFVFFGVFFAVLFAASAANADTLDRSTPRRTLQGFLAQAHDGHYDVAAKYMDLRHIPMKKREAEGRDLAQDLAYVLDHDLPIDPLTISDEPESDDPKSMTYVFTTVTIDGEKVPLTLVRGRIDGAIAWLISRATVVLVPTLDEHYGPNPIEDAIPFWLQRPHLLGHAPWQWIGMVVAAILAALFARLFAASAVALIRRFAKRSLPEDAPLADIVEAWRSPLRLLSAVLAWRGLLTQLHLSQRGGDLATRIAYSLFIVAVAWLIIRGMRAAAIWFRTSLGAEAQTADSREVRTRILMIRRVLSVIIVVVAGAFLLLQFDAVRNVGVSLLASAGVAGVVFGLAAQRTLSAVIAGVQLSLAQPLRIGDRIKIEAESGIVEEIHLTYIIVKAWDERRIVYPVQKVLEQAFENWTKIESQLIGSVTLSVDFATPVQKVREALTGFCKDNPLWDGRVAKLIVHETDASGMTLRAAMSARNADDMSDLRNEVREHLVSVIRDLERGKYLVRTRVEQATAPS